jgi:group I intron endonuclease
MRVSEGASAPFVFLVVLLVQKKYTLTEIKGALQKSSGGRMTRGIYKIINVINNKFYVGSAVNFVERKRKHWWMLRKGTHANKHLQAAWIKYGEQAFVFVVVEDLPDDIDLLAAENVWLKEHVGKGHCYNLATNATAPTLGWYGEKNPMWGKTFSHTEEAKIKIAAASTGRKHTPEDIEKIRRHLIGKPKSAEVRAKISATLSGEGNHWYGKKRPDHGAKVSRAVVATKPDGQQVQYASIQALREATGMKPPSVNRALKSGAPLKRGPYVRWSFKYLDAPLAQ